ncbi:transposase [Siccationidurans soli]|uniref:Transposase n=1 Tax=Hymenobacter negativus TaxID=2795026 RepID=A0ABS3QFD8_9BACT|nr:transposase [Hymenobacter negativus]
MSRPQSRGLRHKSPCRSRRVRQLLALALTAADRADRTQLPALLAALAQPLDAVMCDKAYDSNNVLQAIPDQSAALVILPKAGHLNQRAYDRNRYADRNKIERFFRRIKEAWGFATRYEKNGRLFFSYRPPASCP